MTSQDAALEAIHGRIAKLERQNRRMRKIGGAALVVAAAFAFLAQAPPGKTIEANEFVLRDNNGKIRARLFVGQDPTVPSLACPMLTLYDENEQPRMVLDQKLLSFYSSDASEITMLGPGSLTVSSTKSEQEFSTLTPGTLWISDKEGFSATLGMTDLVTPRTGESHKTSAASLVLFNKDKNVIWKAP